MTDTQQRELLMAMFHAAVDAAHPRTCLPPHLPDVPPDGRLLILAAGKAAGSMAEAAEKHYAGQGVLDKIAGLAVTRYGYGGRTDRIKMMEAGHPVPDDQSIEGAARALELAGTVGPDDTVLVLLSGGASALWTAPCEGVTLEDQRGLTRQLLRGGARISEINTVRKHLSRIQGGRLAWAAAPARLITLAISDVPGDDPSSIGSGPTVGDPTTLADAREIIARYGITPAPGITAALNDDANETPSPDDPAIANAAFTLVARPMESLEAGAAIARSAGYEPEMLGDALEGEARDLGREHANLARKRLSEGRNAVLLSGGEVTVTVRGNGRGGPNQEYALGLAAALEGAEGIAALAADTDGTDGGEGAASDPAGSIVDSSTLSRAKVAGMDPASFLENNDATGFFEGLDDLIIIGPTQTNVNDFRAILITPPAVPNAT